VSIVCAARPGAPHLDWLLWRSPRSLDLDDARWQPEGSEAVRAFWQHHGARMTPKLPDDVIAAAGARAEGNLLPAAVVRAMLLALPPEQRTGARIPRGLTGLWEQTLAQVQALPAEQRRLAQTSLALLSAAQAALPPSELAALLGGEGDLAQAL